MINLTIANDLKQDLMIKVDGIKGLGTQYLFQFENNYGASIVHDFLADLDEDRWELAVLVYRNNKWDVTYDTKITNDVIDMIDHNQVMDVLREIKNL